MITQMRDAFIPSLTIDRTARFQLSIYLHVLSGGDPDGDGTHSMFLYRPTSGFTYSPTRPRLDPVLSPPTDGTLFFGVPTDRFVIGDWDGGGTDTLRVFRPGDTTVYLRNTNTTDPPTSPTPTGRARGHQSLAAGTTRR